MHSLTIILICLNITQCVGCSLQPTQGFMGIVQTNKCLFTVNRWQKDLIDLMDLSNQNQ